MFGAFGVFLANLSAPILLLRVSCPCFSLIIHYFYKKLCLYIQIQNIYLGFEFVQQRIRDCVSVVHAYYNESGIKRKKEDSMTQFGEY